MKEGFLSVLKFLLFLVFLPLTIAAYLSFEHRILELPASKEQSFLWGVLIFTALYIFLYNFKEVFVFGQTTVSNLFKFLGSFDQIMGYVIPIYTILIVCLILILNIFNVTHRYEWVLTLLLGFTVALHIIGSAHEIYESDASPIKGHYLLMFSIVLVVDFIILALLISCVLPDFKALSFFKALLEKAEYYYQSIYKLLFISPS